VQPLVALDDIELDDLPGFERFVTFHLNRGIVSKKILAALIGKYESIALGVVEPLDGTCRHGLILLIHLFIAQKGRSWLYP
jgi:hypothetical protein